MANTSIEWTDITWNPVRGCSRISRGCERCYAERMAARGLPGMSSPTTGDQFAIMTDSGPRWTGKVELIESKLTEPLHWRKSRLVFVNSMSDLFHDSLPDEAIDRVFAVMALCPQHTFQCLSKRPARMQRYCSDTQTPYRIARVMDTISAANPIQWPLPEVWIGISVEDQKTADERIPLLLHTPAAVRFVSAEPLLSAIEISRWLSPSPISPSPISLIIVGGESGPGARPFDLDWARSVRDQCVAAGVPFFVKQLGSNPVAADPIGSAWALAEGYQPSVARILLKDRKGGDMEEFPSDLRIREFPESRG